MKVTRSHHPISLLILYLAVIISIAWSWKDLLNTRSERAMKLYEEGNYEDALSVYSEEAVENPDSPKVLYNLGNMLYRNDRFEDALPPYSHAQDETDIKQAAVFNTGNALYRAGSSSGDGEKLKQSLEAYKEAIRLDPGDLDAKYNYEFVKKLLSEQQQQQNKSSDSDSLSEKQDQQKNQPEDQQEDKSGEEKSGDEDQKKQKQGDTADKKQSPENEKGQPPETEKESSDARMDQQSQPRMNQDDARRMLEALENKEKDQLAQRFKAMGKGKIDVEKDW